MLLRPELGRTDDGEGGETLVAAIDRTCLRPDGGTFHFIWSLAPVRKAAESNDVLRHMGWTRFAQPQPSALYPARS